MVKINDVIEVRPERVTPRPLQQRLQWTAPLNPFNQRIITALIKYLLSGQIPP